MADNNMISFEQFMELKKQFEEAQNDDTPHLAVTPDEELHVIGDPNKTEVKTADYTVYFLFPDTKEFRNRALASGYVETDKINGDTIKSEVPKGYFLCKAEFNNVFISPRNVGSAVTAMAMVEQFYYEVTDEGDLKDLSFEQTVQVFQAMNHEIGDATYEVVAAVLRIPEAEVEWMLPMNTVENAIKIVVNNPDIANGADLFFGLSSSKEA